MIQQQRRLPWAVQKFKVTLGGTEVPAAPAAVVPATIDATKPSGVPAGGTPGVPPGETPQPGVPGETINLTTEKGEEATGSAKDDLIKGVVGTSKVTTLHNIDKIDGAGGNDTLEVDLKSNFYGMKDPGFIKNVEKIVLKGDGKTFDAKGIEGVKAYELDGKLTVKNAAAIETLNVSDLKAGDKAEIKFTKAPDNIVMNLNDVKGTVETGVKDVTLHLTGENAPTLAQAKKIAADGNASLTLDGANVKSFDGSGLTGKVKIENLAAANVKVVKTGSSDDTINFATAVGTTAAIDGGEGNDTLVLKNAAASSLSNAITNVENIVFDGTSTVSVDASNMAGLKNLTLKGAGENLTLVNTGANSDLTFVVINDGAVIADNDGKASVVYAKTAAAAAGLKLLDASSLDLTSNATGVLGITEIFAGKAADVVINNAGAAPLTLTKLTAPEAGEMTVKGATAVVISKLDANPDSLTVTADKLMGDLTLGAAPTHLTSKIVNVTGSILGANEVYATGSNELTVKGGTSDDTIHIEDLAGDATLDIDLGVASAADEVVFSGGDYTEVTFANFSGVDKITLDADSTFKGDVFNGKAVEFAGGGEAVLKADQGMEIDLSAKEGNVTVSDVTNNKVVLGDDNDTVIFKAKAKGFDIDAFKADGTDKLDFSAINADFVTGKTSACALDGAASDLSGTGAAVGLVTKLTGAITKDMFAAATGTGKIKVATNSEQLILSCDDDLQGEVNVHLVKIGSAVDAAHTEITLLGTIDSSAAALVAADLA